MEVRPAEAKAIATSAYVFLVPLVTNYVDMYHEAVDPSSVRYHGGFAHWLHQRISISAESDVATEHVARLRSSVWLDLRSEPWVVSVPAINDDRVSTVRISDLWDFVADEATETSDHVRVLVPSPGWMGKVPVGVDRVSRGESSFVEVEISVQFDESRDLSQIRRVQQEFALTPLSALAGVAPPISAPPVSWCPIHGDVMTNSEFWSVANFALSLTTPHPEDRSILERIAEIGVAAGRRWDATAFDDHVLEAIGEGIDAALTDLMRASERESNVSGADCSRAGRDRDYFGRALEALRRSSGPVSV